MALLLTPARVAFLAGAVVLLLCAARAEAVTIESIDGRSAVTGTAMTTFTDDGRDRLAIRCTHDISIPTSAFNGTSSVSVSQSNNRYTSCRDGNGATCTVSVLGAWTITVTATTSGTIRLDSGSGVNLDCTSRAVRVYSCIIRVLDLQSLVLTFTNPVSPARTGTLRVDPRNALTYTIESGSSRCPLVTGTVGDRGTATMGETIATENVRIVP
jgi:hypothetical protein